MDDKVFARRRGGGINIDRDLEEGEIIIDIDYALIFDYAHERMLVQEDIQIDVNNYFTLF